MDRNSMDRINVRTSDAIDVWLFRLEKECMRNKLSSNGRKLRKEQIVNSIVAKAMAEGVAQAIEAIREGLPIYEQQLRDMGLDTQDQYEIVVTIPTPEEARQRAADRKFKSRHNGAAS